MVFDRLTKTYWSARKLKNKKEPRTISKNMDEFGKPLVHCNDNELHDSVDNPNMYQYIDLIRGESEDQAMNVMFDFDGASTTVSEANTVVNSLLSSLNGEERGRDREERNDGDYSSGTTRATTIRKSKADRLRTLILARRRRSRTKEKLYQLRALVPNISKMDKASIVGDAVLYIQELQMKAKKLKAEIADVEASLAGPERCQELTVHPKRTGVESNKNPICKNIMQMDVFQVEETGFYLRLVCNKGEGVPISLHKALESITRFNVHSSNLVTVSGRFVFTFTLKVKDSEQNIHLSNLTLWVSSALLNQGFHLLTPLSA